MKKGTLLFVISFICFAKAQKIHQISIVKAIMGDKVATLNTQLCWSELELVKLFKEICNERIKCRILGTELPDGEDEFRSLILIDLNCEESWKFIENIDFHKHLKLKFVFLNTEEERLLNVLDSQKLGPITDITYLSNKGNALKKVYKTGRNEPPSIEPHGFFNGTNISFIKKPNRYRQNLHKSSLRGSMVIAHNESLNHLLDYRDTHIDTIGKLNYMLTNHVIDFLNASITYSIVKSWGYKDKQTNEYNGMIGELTKDEADLGATAMFYTTNRIDVVQYVARTSRTGLTFVFQAPKKSFTDNVFLMPFSSVVWICIIFLIPILGVPLAVVIYLEHKNDESISKKNVTLDAVYVVFTAMCQQGAMVSMKSPSIRIIVVFTFVAAIFLYSSFSANIVSLIQSPSSKIQTLEDLLHSRILLGADDTVYNRFYLPRQTESIQKQIYDQKIAKSNGEGNFLPLAEGISRIRKGLFGFYFESGPGYKIMQETYEENEKCGLIDVQYIKFIEPHYAIQKNSTYHELIKIGLFRVFEHGLQQRENDRLYTRKPVCSSTSGKFIPVSIVDVQPAFFLLCWGFGFSLATALMEFFMKKIKSKKTTKRLIRIPAILYDAQHQN